MPRVIPPDGFDQLDWNMADSKGYIEDIVVQVSPGHEVAVTFYDPIRLAQDIEAELNEGASSLSWLRLVVVKEISMGALQAAIDAAPSEFFD